MLVAKLDPSEPMSKLIGVIEKHSKSLSEERSQFLTKAAESIVRLQQIRGQVNLLFVCTHNSRRSHFSDFWTQVAMSCYGAENLSSSSCGTETTECNPRTIASLQRVGFDVSSDGKEQNPHYSIPFGGREITLFSKAFGAPGLPTSDVVAMMCCNDAEENCPIIPGAEHRVSLHYKDPKSADGTDAEAATYDARSLQIASEMFFLVRQIAKSV